MVEHSPILSLHHQIEKLCSGNTFCSYALGPDNEIESSKLAAPWGAVATACLAYLVPMRRDEFGPSHESGESVCTTPNIHPKL